MFLEVVTTYSTAIYWHDKLHGIAFPDKFANGTISIKFRQLVSFVAIKNGEHNSRGFAYCSKGFKEFMPENESHISKFRNSVESYFQLTER